MCLNVVDCSAGSQQCGEELPRKPHGLPARGIRSGEIVQRFPHGYIREIYFSEQQRLKTFPFDLFIGIVLNYCCSALISYYFRCSFRRYGS